MIHIFRILDTAECLDKFTLNLKFVLGIPVFSSNSQCSLKTQKIWLFKHELQLVALGCFVDST